MFKAARFAPRGRAFVALPVALVAGALLSVGLTQPAFADAGDPSTLIVHVTNKAGAPMNDGYVSAEAVSDGADTTDGDFFYLDPVNGEPGTYEVDGLVQGQDYALYFDPDGSSVKGSYDQYLGGSQDLATAEVYTPTTARSSLDVTLLSASSLSGVVKNSANHGMKDVDVLLYKFDGANWIQWNETGTSSSGAYSFPDLETGSYTVEFFGPAPYVTTFAGGATSPESATHAYVSPGKSATLSATLVAGGSISGVVSAPGGSPKLEGIYIQTIALRGTPGHFTSEEPVLTSPESGGDTTPSTGKFTESSLPTGYYALSFNDASNTYRDTFDSPVTNPLSTTPIYHVTAGKATSAGTVQLPLRSDATSVTISGSLDSLDAFDGDTAGGHIEFYETDGTFAGSAQIQDDGSFSISMEPGTYNYDATVSDYDDWTLPFKEETGTVDAADDASIVVPVEPAGDLDFTTDPSLADTASTEVGTTFSVNPVQTTWPSGLYTVSYQWYRNNTPIYGATNATYTAQGVDVNDYLVARVRLQDYIGQYLVTKYANSSAAVTQSDDLFNTVSPTSTTDASGQLAFGQTAHASAGQWNGITGLTYSYKWIDTTTGNTVSTNPTFTADPTVGPSELGDSFILEVRASKLGYTTPWCYTADETPFVVVQNAAAALKVAPKVTSKTVGTVITYTVTPGTWSVAGTTTTYEWDLDGAIVATGTSYAYDTAAHPVHSQSSLTVKVGATKDGYADASTTLIVRKADTAFTGAPGVIDVGVGALTDSSNEVYPGETLGADTAGTNYASDGTAATSFSYQWQRSTTSVTTFANIAGATKSTYKIATADAGHQLRLVLTGSSSLHSATSIIETGGTVVLDNSLVVDAGILPVGVSHSSDQPGTKFAKSSLPWDGVNAVTDSYQWLVCSAGVACGTDPKDATKFVAISGAKSATYTPPLTMAGKEIALRVTGGKLGYATGTAYSAALQLGDGKTIVPLTLPTVVSGLVGGNAKVGVKLTVKSGTYNVPGITVTYKWWRYIDGSATNVGQGVSYTPKASDFGGTSSNYLEVDEFATKAGYTDADANDITESLGLTATSLKVAPKVTTVAGSWVVAKPTWNSGATSSYEWFVDGVSTASGTSLTQPQTGAVTVVATSDDSPGYSPASTTVVAQKGAAPAWNTPTIGGTPKYGQKLTAPTDPAAAFVYPVTATPKAALTYQWYYSSTSTGKLVAISKATGSTLTPSTSYIGKWISVKITATSPLYATASHQTAPVQFTAGDALDLLVGISNGDPVHPGTKAVVNFTGVSPLSGQVHTYQWQTSTDDGASWANVSGATKSSLVLLAGDLGKKLRVLVTTTKSGYTTAHDYSDAVAVTQAVVLVPTTEPTLTGNSAAGSLLTVAPGVWNVASTYTYQWYRDGAIIPGVTGTTYTSTGSEDGEDITVTVTAHASGYQTVTVSPAAITVTDGAAPTAITVPTVSGANAVGEDLTVTPGVWSLDGVTISYQWFDDSGAIAGATSNTFTVTNDQLGLTVYAVVTVSRAGYTSTTVQTAGITIDAD